MSLDHPSRRKFLRNIAAGSTATALIPLPEGHSSPLRDSSAGSAPPDPPFPMTVDSYPISEPGLNPTVDRLKIVTYDEFPTEIQEKIRGFAPGIELKHCRNDEEFGREVADANVIFGGVSREDLAVAKKLRWVQYPAAGVENVLSPELVSSPVVLTNMQRMYSPTISESVFALLLALTRGINRYTVQTREHEWKEVEGLSEISGLTMGLVGMGGIGTDTAYRAHYGFHMKVLGVDPKPLPKPTFVAELHSLEWLPKMASQVDVLVCAAPHTHESEKMLNESVFRAMKPSAYFINVSRGKVVDTPALIRALQEKWIAGAGLDVVYREPLPADDPLWSAPNVLITCHTSARSQGSLDRSQALFVENVRRYVAGLPLLNVVDKKRGY
ncbi:MAG TPA: D-2-hydroxyacid dehydrogenase [Terriglobia bacterium]|nr:D-2-hydroxyacid dehydrogenase [Terriglobia bacterium]